MFEVSLLIPARNREQHANILFSHLFKDVAVQDNRIQVIIIDGNLTKTYHEQAKTFGFTYIHSPCEGIFHKTKLLNIGLSYAQGIKVVPYDIDLLPWGNTLAKHCNFSMTCPNLLVSGYRLMVKNNVNMEHIQLHKSDFEIAPENSESALFKYLSQRERFAVCPFFDKKTILSINGWDEKFKGWGAEDQDILERYLRKSKANLIQSYDLLYMHLWHPVDNDWGEQEHIGRNRSLFNKRG